MSMQGCLLTTERSCLCPLVVQGYNDLGREMRHLPRRIE